MRTSMRARWALPYLTAAAATLLLLFSADSGVSTPSVADAVAALPHATAYAAPLDDTPFPYVSLPSPTPRSPATP